MGCPEQEPTGPGVDVTVVEENVVRVTVVVEVAVEVDVVVNVEVVVEVKVEVDELVDVDVDVVVASQTEKRVGHGSLPGPIAHCLPPQIA